MVKGRRGNLAQVWKHFQDEFGGKPIRRKFTDFFSAYAEQDSQDMNMALLAFHARFAHLVLPARGQWIDVLLDQQKVHSFFSSSIVFYLVSFFDCVNMFL